MKQNNIDKRVKTFLGYIFCVVGNNSPYNINDFVHLLLDAAEHQDFTTNTGKRVNGPTGETVFSRLKEASFDKIKSAFYDLLVSIFPLVKSMLRNRKVALAFDVTDEPYYGKIKGLWIHGNRPVRGSTGCFKYLTISAVDRDQRFILGSLPVRVGEDTVTLVLELLRHAQQFVQTETLLFDRGFDNYRLIAALQKAKQRYQILWRKDKWTKKFLRVMKRGERLEVLAIKEYKHKKSKHKVKVRFVFIKAYKRYKKSKAYDWVFATNTRKKYNYLYVDKYRMRWGIETIFRVLDRIGIKTTTKNEVIRYFLHMFCCMVYNLWKYVTLIGEEISLKNFTAHIATIVGEMLKRRLRLDTG